MTNEESFAEMREAKEKLEESIKAASVAIVAANIDLNQSIAAARRSMQCLDAKIRRNIIKANEEGKQ